MAIRRPTPLLSPGDTIEYSLSQEVPTHKSSTWVKVGVTSTIRDEESVRQARTRITEFVERMLTERIVAISPESR